MKFYLLQNICSSLRHSGSCHFNVNYERHATRLFWDFVPVDITPFDQSSSEVNKCALLKAFLETQLSAVGANPTSRDRDDFWTLAIRLAVSSVNHRNGRLMLPRSDVRRQATALSKLADLFEGITVQLDFSLLENEQDDARVLTTIQSKDVTLLKKKNLIDESVLFPAEYFLSRINVGGTPVYARVTMTVTIPDNIFNARFGTTATAPKSWAQKMLEDGVLTDVTIVCGDGKEVLAHRSCLAARSSVFLTMFQTDMKESRESTVEIPDMEEKTVRAFLKYLYYDDTKDAEEEFTVALELFKAGHKYAVQCLEGKMRKLLLNKPNDQIGIQGALKLFFFARNLIPAEEELMKKAIRVLERYSENLKGSPEMQQLFRTDHQAALELFQYAFKRN